MSRYHTRKEQGQRKRAEYLRRLDHAQHLALVFRAIAVGVGFMFVMGFVANTNRLLEVVLMIAYLYVIVFSLLLAEQILLRAEQSRYPKSRRKTLWNYYTDK